MISSTTPPSRLARLHDQSLSNWVRMPRRPNTRLEDDKLYTRTPDRMRHAGIDPNDAGERNGWPLVGGLAMISIAIGG
jgi:hypothetical protein